MLVLFKNEFILFVSFLTTLYTYILHTENLTVNKNMSHVHSSDIQFFYKSLIRKLFHFGASIYQGTPYQPKEYNYN